MARFIFYTAGGLGWVYQAAIVDSPPLKVVFLTLAVVCGFFATRPR